MNAEQLWKVWLKNPLNLYKKIHKEAITTTGEYYKNDHQMGFDKHGPLAYQTENSDLPGLGIVNIVDTARAMAAYAASARVAGGLL